MPEYEVDLVRTYYGFATVKISAPNQNAAKKRALEVEVDFSGLDGEVPDEVVRIRRLPPPPKPPKRDRMVEGTDEWEAAANNVARGEVDLYPCQHCGYPVNRGTCCLGCGSDDPDPD